jgi:hypothetical protein
MNYLYLDSSPNKDQQKAFSSSSTKIEDKNTPETSSSSLQGSLFALPVLEKEQVDVKQTDNEFLILVNKMKDQLTGSKTEETDDSEDEQENVLEFSDLNMGTQFYMSSLSIVGLYILYKLLLKTK